MRKVLAIVIFCFYLGTSKVEGKTCNVKFGGCDKSNGLCWNTKWVDNTTHSFCTCKSGYNFQFPATRSGKCVNINECKTGLHSCDTVHGRCVDTRGSHRCVCNSGYVLDYTKTKCLRAKKIKGSCRRSRRKCRDSTKRFSDIEERVKFMLRLHRGDNEETGDEDDDNDQRDEGKSTSRKNSCSCEAGYELRGGCKYCQDINECKRKTSMCDLKNGYCHNSDGGYFCTCKTGFVLGPCGFKCYTPKKRPKKCTSETFSKHSLVKGDSDGLNDETSKAVLLDYITEKAAATGGRIIPYQTLMNGKCKTGQKKHLSYDVDRDGKADVRVTYTCLSKVWNVKSVFDSEAYWTKWTCWTECRATCSGGIQTRTRICKHGLVGEGKCSGPATKQRTCYKGRRCKLRVRRDASTLNKKQQKDLIQAMRKYKKDTSTYGFFNAAGSHVFPNQCMGTNGRSRGCCYHGARLNFAIWHRAELLNFEEGLTRHLKDKTLGLPYWDWLKHPNPPGIVWNKKINGKDNPFASSTCRYDMTPHAKTTRTAKVNAKSVLTSKNAYLNVARKLMQAHTIHEFSEALENSHNTIHDAVCITLGDACKYSMGGLTYAAFDPIFFFHHANVDRLFSVFQQFMATTKEVAWTRQSVLEPQENILHFNEYMQPFRNKTLTPFKKLHALSTIENLFYYKQMLGYKYDSLEVTSTPKTKSKTVGDSEKDHVATNRDTLQIAQFEKNVKSNVKISYYFTDKVKNVPNFKGPCSKQTEKSVRHIGNVTILGSKNERPWKSRQATILPVTSPFARSMVGSKLTTKSNLHLTACYTHNMNCDKNCKQVSAKVRKLIPSPQLLFFPRDIRQDIFKFEWASNKRYPDWQLDIDSGTQWVQFWGKEAANVVQVGSKAKFHACNSKGAKKVKCTRPCILQTGVHYFIHKNAAKCRKGMKLNLLANL